MAWYITKKNVSIFDVIPNVIIEDVMGKDCYRMEKSISVGSGGGLGGCSIPVGQKSIPFGHIFSDMRYCSVVNRPILLDGCCTCSLI